ncbi:VOC family protein [Ruminiclostridium cellobioparum]|uniref:Glyoxalase/Bleomycin resistance protein/Dioxygenase superfamily n=1 Tax=Ruminiclostridium cellobioparum subsp. termitidis CT1112 TaxID=1195236 RepID=S0FKD3_RUMCE|nr:VOC family protein [Ruminiclostridium cellobioparum]EMS72675.1 Glyoxalase/Bleomycin resistance protein/Dioxygenase superfamily [Ruminiclostridium cellobioparum subsp. termitidis CT1112]
MITLKKMQHIGIIVPDAGLCAKWYIEHSGFKEKAEFHHEGSRVKFVYSADAGILCELIQRPQGSDDAQRAQLTGGWIDHIAYEVEDIEKEFETAKAEKLDIIEGIVEIPGFWEAGFQYFLVRSPGGEKVEYCKVL